MTAKRFDEHFDRGEDISAFVDPSTGAFAPTWRLRTSAALFLNAAAPLRSP
jgi:hypothetical protein